MIQNWLPLCVQRILTERTIRKWSLVDISAYDGLCTLDLLQQVEPRPTQVMYVDQEANKKQISARLKTRHIKIKHTTYSTTAEQSLPKLALPGQLAILVHSAYDVRPATLDALRTQSDRGVFIIVHGLHSIFDALWKETRPELWQQFTRLQEWLTLNGTILEQNHTALTLPSDEPTRTLVLSHLCLKDYASLTNDERRYVDQHITPHLSEDGTMFIEHEAWYIPPTTSV